MKKIICTILITLCFVFLISPKKAFSFQNDVHYNKSITIKIETENHEKIDYSNMLLEISSGVLCENTNYSYYNYRPICTINPDYLGNTTVLVTNNYKTLKVRVVLDTLPSGYGTLKAEYLLNAYENFLLIKLFQITSIDFRCIDDSFDVILKNNDNELYSTYEFSESLVGSNLNINCVDDVLKLSNVDIVYKAKTKNNLETIKQKKLDLASKDFFEKLKILQRYDAISKSRYYELLYLYSTNDNSLMVAKNTIVSECIHFFSLPEYSQELENVSYNFRSNVFNINTASQLYFNSYDLTVLYNIPNCTQADAYALESILTDVFNYYCNQSFNYEIPYTYVQSSSKYFLIDIIDDYDNPYITNESEVIDENTALAFVTYYNGNPNQPYIVISDYIFNLYKESYFLDFIPQYYEKRHTATAFFVHEFFHVLMCNYSISDYNFHEAFASASSIKYLSVFNDGNIAPININYASAINEYLSTQQEGFARYSYGSSIVPLFLYDNCGGRQSIIDYFEAIELRNQTTSLTESIFEEASIFTNNQTTGLQSLFLNFLKKLVYFSTNYNDYISSTNNFSSTYENISLNSLSDFPYTDNVTSSLEKIKTTGSKIYKINSYASSYCIHFGNTTNNLNVAIIKENNNTLEVLFDQVITPGSYFDYYVNNGNSFNYYVVIYNVNISFDNQGNLCNNESGYNISICNNHSYSNPINYNDSYFYHKRMCSTCGAMFDEPHTYLYFMDTNEYHSFYCTGCSFGDEEEHFVSTYQYRDYSTHYRYCICQYDMGNENHIIVNWRCILCEEDE